ncbi:major histocompatibility complex class I-related gene protein-like isoform X1 [Hypomesus transpacificus]|uniref:major histocompatibility complex class I-related gene protein-like isoform X1 n=1 Tax=Hypomesus transpacificus TaxID=137520 RepID=UPI001F0750B3|nr:major histocompatibility complex class I-related gene protein-like isoform X1 [Hypomesus transpacificus]
MNLSVLLVNQDFCFAATHSLKYFYTATSGLPNFPEFVTVGLMDGLPITYYDSNIRRETPRQDWMAETESPEYWERQTQESISAEHSFKANIDIAKQRFNQSGGVHSFQRMYGCEWDDETGATDGFNQYGYNGEDLLVLDLKNLRYIAPVEKAATTKYKWDHQKGLIESDINYLTQYCIDWLKMYLKKKTLKRTVPPSLSLLQKSPSSPVTCHATGFYPSSVIVFWRRDGDQVYEDVDYGQLLPNEDGTFQNSVHLTVKPEDLDSGRYECVVQLLGVQEDFVTRLERSVVKTNLGNTGRTNPGSEGSGSSGLIIGAVVGVLLLVAIVCGVIIWKKKNPKKGFAPANSSDDGSNSSDYTAPKA